MSLSLQLLTGYIVNWSASVNITRHCCFRCDANTTYDMQPCDITDITGLQQNFNKPKFTCVFRQQAGRWSLFHAALSCTHTHDADHFKKPISLPEPTVLSKQTGVSNTMLMKRKTESAIWHDKWPRVSIYFTATCSSIVVVVFSFIKQLSDATGSKMGFTIKQFTEETRIH